MGRFLSANLIVLCLLKKTESVLARELPGVNWKNKIKPNYFLDTLTQNCLFSLLHDKRNEEREEGREVKRVKKRTEERRKRQREGRWEGGKIDKSSEGLLSYHP